MHEYELAQYLDRAWALHPLELSHENGQSTLILEDPGGELLSDLLHGPMDVATFLNYAVSITAAASRMHQQGLVHKDLKPANILIDPVGKQAWLTGFGIASRLPRERQVPVPPEFIAGTLAYMAPEQTGRMNRSIDSRSDLYALGVTFYQMLTGRLPFDASDAMEWMHCHVARQPASPASLVPALPMVLSAIVLKLLAKAAEDRYQTAIGLEHDLRRCLTSWEICQRADPFVVAERDVPSRLLLPEKLYGRQQNIEALLAAFEGVMANGEPELVLVSGYSGVGKSALVNELQKVIAPSRGFFASGKFDQYKRDIPYATLGQAFNSIIRQLLSRSEAELSRWREKLAEALEPNGLLIADLIPELKLIIGPQPAVSELSPHDAKSRFQLVFRRFIATFARPEHPLVLFLDDLQWLDLATLDLIEALLTQPAVSHLLLIGAYRDNEVSPEHPLMRKLQIISQGLPKTRHISLAALNSQDLTSFVSDSLHCDRQRAAPLARLIFRKTAGNPFFAIQFVSTLIDEGLLALDYSQARWNWDLTHIEHKGYTDNVANLIVDRLARLPIETQRGLQELACLGNSAEVALLSMIHGTSEERIHEDLWQARHGEFVMRSDGSYKFVHDRVQEAAYSLIPEARRPETHLRIGRLLTSSLPTAARAEVIFNIVAQFDAGSELITSRDERELVAELNLIAGKRAKASAAYTSALKYLVAGVIMLPDDCWERRHSLVFELELHQAECEFLTGNYDAAHQRLTMLSSRAAGAVEQSAAACLSVDLYVMHYQTDLAIAAYLNYLAQQGIKWSRHPTVDDVRREYDRVYLQLGDRAIETLAELPLMSDPVALATIDVLAKVIALTGMLTDGANVRGLVVGRMTNLSLQYGNSDGSCLAYVLFGSMAGAQFDNQGDGNRFARLGIELVERRNLRRFQGRTYRTFAENVSLWTEHIGIGCNLLRQGFEAAKRTGEAAYAAYIVETLTRLLLASGQSLAEVQLETELGLEFATTTRVEFVVDLMSQRLAFIKALRGLTANVSSYPENFGAASSESDTVIDQQKLVARSFFCVGVLKACYHAGDYSAALDASRGAEPLLSIPTAFVERAEYHFYAGLCHAASIALAGVEERGRHIDALMAHQRQIAIWAIQCPDNFENRAVLLSAEVARIEGRELDAETLYERAIHLARLKRFHHNEAIASELAAAFHTARGLPTIANAYLREARSCYRRWGAESKVRQLDARYPQLRQSAADNTASIATQIEHLDFATVVKVSHALSGELVLDKLIDVLMRLAIEHAGAERGVLLLVRGDQLLQESEGITSRNGIVVRRQDGAAAVLPDAIVQYVMRTREIVIIDDAASDPTYSRDQYVIKRRTRSVLCLPLVNDTRLNGVLYLENGLAAAVFTPDRTAILKLLASQAAVSLENTYLYRDLAQAIEHLRKAEIHLAGEKRVLEMIASGQRLRDVLAALCKFFEDSVPDCYCGIYPIDARSNTFEYGVAPSLPASYTEAVDGLSLAFDDSPRGRSTSNKLQVVAEDIGSDPRWSDAPCRLHVLKHGLRAVWSTPILSRDGSVIGTVCVYQQTPGGPSADHQEVISHIVRLASIAIVRSQAETALKRSETFLTEGQRISLTGSFSWRVDNDELRFSQQLRRIFEFDANEEITLQMMRDRIHPDDLPILSEKQAQVRSGQNDHEYDIRLRMPVGDVKYLRVFGRAIRHEDGHIEYLGAAQDVSRRRLAEEARDKVRSELARVSRVVSLGALTASIAHEINQPIASIITNGETGLRWLKREEPNLTKIEDALKRVIGDAKRGAKIVDGIRTMASRGSSRHSEINLTEVVAASIAFVQHELQMRNVSISLEDQADLPIVLGDRTQLQQVIINLVLNAAQALTKAGLRKNSIAVRLQKIEGMVCCVVEDSGSGIDLEHLPHLFDSFFTTKETGMGLGLQITQSIIEAHGGHIAGDNSSVLGGARFTFRLPVVSDQARAPN